MIRIDELGDILQVCRDARRTLHRYPETGGQEIRTCEYLERFLTGLGLEVHRFQNCFGLMAVMRGPGQGCVAVRADMDALPIQESPEHEICSENPGIMHACGHDFHMAMALGSAMWFARHPEKVRGTIKWLFEPMEETIGGARLMAEQGCMENPHVDYIIGQHVNPSYPCGTFICKDGYVSGSSDSVLLTVTGEQCHGAYPHRGVDAIVLASQVITALQTLISRTKSPFDPAVLTLGTIEGGQAPNIVCGEVRLRGTLRVLSTTAREELIRKAQGLVKSVAEGMGGRGEILFQPGCPALWNDPDTYAVAVEAAREVLGDSGLIARDMPSLGVESFSYLLENSKGVFYDLGSGISTALHTPTFIAQEEVLGIGIAIQCNTLSLLMAHDREVEP